MKLVFGTKPWPHQVRALKFVLRARSALIQCPMRWGKSWVGIHWAAGLHELENISHVLVITVTSGLDVWEDQIAEHCPLTYRVVDHHGELRLEDSSDPQLTFMIVNYANLYTRVHTGQGREWVTTTNRVLSKFNAQAIIADEIHHLGNPTAEQSKQACALARKAFFKLGLTGTAFHRKPFFVFGQVKFIDDGKTFGTAWTHFKKRIAVFGGFGGYEVKRYQNLRWMMDSIKPFVYIERKVPKRPTVRNKLTFRLTGKHLAAYEKLEKDRVLDIGKGDVLTSEIILTQHLRLLQIAGGFVKRPGGGYACVGTNKVEMFRDRIREYREQGIEKAVVGCRFVPELAACAKVAKAEGFEVILFHGGVPKGAERRRRKDHFWKIDKPALFISQISAGKEAIDLSVASVMLYYSLTESFLEYDQFSARIAKYGETRTLMYDYLLARGTRDEVTYAAMQVKKDVAKFLATDPERVEALLLKR